MSDSCTQSETEFHPIGDQGGDSLFSFGFSHEYHLSNAQKWYISLVVGIIFVIFISPTVLGLFDSISMSICAPPMGGNGLTLYGLIILTLIFVIVVRVLLM